MNRSIIIPSIMFAAIPCSAWDVASADPFSPDPAWRESRPDPLSSIRAYTIVVDRQKIVYEVDESRATFSLTAPEKITLMESGQSAATAVKEEELLYPSYLAASEVPSNQGMILPSVELCGQRGKFFDDGMYGALELTLETGGKFSEPGKRRFCEKLAEMAVAKLAAAPPEQKRAWTAAASYAVAAALLSQPDSNSNGMTNAPSDVRQLAGRRIADFKNDLLFSKPLGFYALNPELGRIFTRDRFLQQKLGSADLPDEADTALALAVLVTDDSTLRQANQFLNRFYGRLTNPQACLTVDALAAAIDPAQALTDSVKHIAAKELLKDRKGLAMIPPSSSAETDLIRQAGGLDAVGGKTMQLVIDAVRAGKLSLAPKPNSGWYAYQQFALESLLRMDGPEAPKLAMNTAYRQRLEEAFRSMLTQARETHVKQLDMSALPRSAPRPQRPGIPPLYVKPDWRLEPIPTCYRRVADGYRFLGNSLSSALGDDLSGISLLDPDMKPAGNLAANLDRMEKLYTGFSILASRGIGIPPVGDGSPAKRPAKFDLDALGDAEQWLANWHENPLMARDIRVIVPMGRDSKGRLSCWAVMGVRPITIEAGYKIHPAVKQVAGPKFGVEVEYAGVSTHTVLVPVFGELVLNSGSPLTRDEFRAICDAGKTKAGILQAIDQRNSSSNKQPRNSPPD